MSSQGDQQGGGAGSWWGWGDSLLQTVKKQVRIALQPFLFPPSPLDLHIVASSFAVL
jgi:hypothetical protein